MQGLASILHDIRTTEEGWTYLPNNPGAGSGRGPTVISEAAGSELALTGFGVPISGAVHPCVAVIVGGTQDPVRGRTMTRELRAVLDHQYRHPLLRGHPDEKGRLQRWNRVGW